MTRSTVVSVDLVDEAVAAIIEHAFIACGVGAEAAVKDMREQISESVGSGVKYPRLPNRSSAPLEAPVNQFDDLHDSIHVEWSPDIIGIGVEVAIDDPIWPYLEFGTSKMRPRPFAGPGAVVGAEATEAYVKTIPAKLENL